VPQRRAEDLVPDDPAQPREIEKPRTATPSVEQPKPERSDIMRPLAEQPTVAKTASEPELGPRPSQHRPRSDLNIGYRGEPVMSSSVARPATSSRTSLQDAAAAQLERLTAAVVKTRRELKVLYKQVRQNRPDGLQAPVDTAERLEELTSRMEALEETVASLPKRIEQQTGRYRAVDVNETSCLNFDVDSLDQSPIMLPSLGTKDNKINKIDRFLSLMVERGASDLHLTVGRAPMFRDSGDIEPLRYRRISQDDWRRLVQPIVPARIWEVYQETGDVDFAYEIGGSGRFRVNLFKQLRGGGAVFRVIPEKIMTIEQLGMPQQVHRLSNITGGLVLVTGPTGSGKSTTLAAIVNEINETRAYHIITLEDPIEFVHNNKK
jgi:flagellar biosynthesis GTPase FlhF